MKKKKEQQYTQTAEYFAKFTGNFTLSAVIKATIEEVIALAEQRTKKKIKDMVVLDVGSGFGAYSFELEKYAKKVIGVEPDPYAYNIATKEAKARKSHVTFFNTVIEKFSTTERFDLLLSLTTIEHMPKQEESFRRVLSLMREDGMLYVTGPNKWWFIEPHYSLPFLSWLPVKLANVYVRMMHKAQSYQDCSYSLSYFGIQRLFNKLPCTYEFYVPSADASYLGCGQQKSSVYKSIRTMGISLIKRYPIFWSISKGFILIVKKR